MIRMSINKKDTTIINIYASKIRALKYMKKKRIIKNFRFFFLQIFERERTRA